LCRHFLVRLTRQPIWFINNGIDLDRVLRQRTGASIRRELGLSADIPLFGLVGRLTEQKGIPDALQAFALVRKRLPQAVMVVVGDGYGEKPRLLKAQATELDLTQSVFWLGARPDAIDIIADLDVLVSASLWEGLPTVILEAMALGTPVVATDIPGTNELILHEQTGLLVPPRNPPALAQAMERLINDRNLAQQLVVAARERVAQFSIASAVKQYEHLYCRLMSMRR
jgi:glycosyltransferase involved in cell wall biosynthesis